MALEFLLKLQDMMTPKLGSSLKAADATLNKTQQLAIKGNKQMGASFEGVRKRIDELRTTANKTTDWRIFKDATRHANDLEKQLDRLQNKASGKSGGMSFGGMLAGGAIAYGAFNLGKDALQLAAEREKQKVNFQVMTGDRNTGNELLQKIIRMADVTPFESQDLIASSKMLLQYGLSVDKVMPTLQKLGDISGADKEKLGSLTMAFGKVISEGKLNGRALEEMIYAGYNPLNDISKKTGISMAELRKQMEKGTITTKMVEDGMTAATSTGGRFDHLMEKQSLTLSGRYSTAMDNYHHKLTDVGEAMMPLASNALTAFSNILEGIQISKTHAVVLAGEKAEVNGLIASITKYNQGSELRSAFVKKLVGEYPDLFKGLDVEKMKNNELLSTLNKINEAYDTRIKLASSQLRGDVNRKKATEQMDNYLRYTAIADAIELGDMGTAESLMNFGEVTIGTKNSKIKHFRILASASLTERNAFDKRANAADSETKSGEFLQTIQEAYALRNNPNALSEKFAKKADRNKFIDLAKQISINGNTYSTNGGGLSFAEKLKAAMNPGSQEASGLGDLKTTSEKAMSGQREVNITINKLGIDTFKLESLNVKEGVGELEKMMKEMFLRIVYSANGMAVN